MKYGLQIKEIESDEYVLGGRQLPRPVLQPDGQWHEFLPDYERQFTDIFDTLGCTVYGTLNAIEMLDRRVNDKKSDYSERYPYNLTPISPPGGDPHCVAETIRKFGLVDQEVLPMTATFDEFKQKIGAKILWKGQEWLKANDFGHEWVWKGNPSKERRTELLKEALRYSPVGVSVSAWHLKDGVYIDEGEPNNHWCVLIGYYDIAGIFMPKVFDSYDQTVKVLHPDHFIQMAKRYTLKPRTGKPAPWWKNIINYFIKK